MFMHKGICDGDEYRHKDRCYPRKHHDYSSQCKAESRRLKKQKSTTESRESRNERYCDTEHRHR